MTRRPQSAAPNRTLTGELLAPPPPPWDDHFNSTQRVYDPTTHSLPGFQRRNLGDETGSPVQGHLLLLPAPPPRQGSSTAVAIRRPQSARSVASTSAALTTKSGTTLDAYNALEDRGLRQYFRTTPSVMRHLQANGLVTNQGFIVEKAQERMNHVDRALEHQRKENDRLADDVNRALSVRLALEQREKERLFKFRKARLIHKTEVEKRNAYNKRTAKFQLPSVAASTPVPAPPAGTLERKSSIRSGHSRSWH